MAPRKSAPGKSASSTRNNTPQKEQSTPPSSPPSEGPMPDEDKAMQDNGVSTTMRAEEEKMRLASERDEAKRASKLEADRKRDLAGGKDAVDSKFKALEYLLSQSKLYSTIMLSQMQKQEEVDTAKDEKSRKRQQNREEKAEKAAQDSQRRTTRNAVAGGADDQPNPTKSRGRQPKLKKEASAAKLTDWLKKEDLEEKAKDTSVKEALEEEASKQGEVKSDGIGVQNLRSARQPDLVSGGIMRSYQLEGLEWLTSLYENGLNGILADEMGLGKTVQTISFIAFLRERGVNGPFLVAAPLSTTNNWLAEFKRWTPEIPVILYHGSKPEREEMRRKHLKNPGSEEFPVICTSYEICMNDRKFLAHYGWKFIIIDEGHRIKNMNCRLIRELQSYQSANRLLITGTPLQNNLSELWSLLHFLMPDIFDKLESFESWFDFSALKEKNGYEQILSEERRTQLVASLHAILKPFLLRRVKADVEHSMPKKREYVLYAPMSEEQTELYQSILHGSSRSFLEDKVFETLSRAGSGTTTPAQKSRQSSLKRKAMSMGGTDTPNKSAKTSRASTPATNGSVRGRGRKARKSQNYSELNDREYFKQLERGAEASSNESEENSSDQAEVQRSRTLALAKRQIAQKKLQNPIMQLRLCCNSPHNFYYPFPEECDETATSPDSADYSLLVSASGKMQLLDQLLRSLLASKADHKVLLFSQFKSQLDILALYIEQCLELPICRIDGSIANADRQEQILLFNESKDHRIFLLSTRAGGQGINLAAADTVILFDSDWNPQQDLQAQDRAHRIGQRKNVVVYRFATRGTVEEMLLEKADGKRRLEKLVIRKGRFKSWTDKADGGRDGEEAGEDDEMAELRGLLGRSDGERFDFGAIEGREILTARDLKILLDRSDEAYERAEKGEDLGAAFKAVETRAGGEGLLESLSK